jgi:diguanylate cyclase (GGDEF)-like protein
MDVLLLGMNADSEATLVRVLRAVGGFRVARSSRWTEVPKAQGFQLVFVGSGAVEPAWGTFEQILRRDAPGAVLVATPDLDTQTFAGEWDDVVWPQEARHDVFVRVLRFAQKLVTAQVRLDRWALRDALTDLLNRRGLEQVLAREASSRDRGQGPVSVLLIDVDDFKHINDTLGMTGGDQVLRAIAQRISDAVRQQDSVARVGGDEFVVLLPGARTWEAVEIAERIRAAVAAGPEGVTVSLGVRRLSEVGERVDLLLEAAQQGLKVSKASGKNQVHLASSKGQSSTCLADAHSLPPGTPLHRFKDLRLQHVGTGAVRVVMRMVDLESETGLQLSMQRAVQAAWDLHWFVAGARLGVQPGQDLHLRLFPATLADMPAAKILGALPESVPPTQLVVSLDEQFLSGDPGSLEAGVAALRARGVRLCLDVSDFGPSCLEALVVLKPERVLLSADAIIGAVRSRSRRAAVYRFARVVRALDLELVADGVHDGAARALIEALGVTMASCSALAA